MPGMCEKECGECGLCIAQQAQGVIDEKNAEINGLNLQIRELRSALVAECRGESCDTEECAGGGYRNCSGCEQRAKEAIHINPGDGSCMREVCGIHEPNGTRKCSKCGTAETDGKKNCPCH